MTIVKRFSVFLCAVVFCFSFVLGSLSFMPKSLAWTPLYANDPTSYFQNPFVVVTSGSDTVTVIELTRVRSPESSVGYNVRVPASGTRIDVHRCAYIVYTYHYSSGLLDWGSPSSTVTADHSSSGASWGVTVPNDSHNAFHSGSAIFDILCDPLEITKPSVPAPSFWDFSPFYFPELPYGEFDGNINVVDGQYNVDLGSLTGTTSNSGDTTTLEHYSFVVPYYNITANSSSSDFDFNDTTGIGHVQNSDYLSGNYTVTGQTTNTVHYVESGSIDINGSAPVSYTPSFNENTRFRSWSLVSDASYIWFISDTRNKITGKVKSVSGDTITLQYVMSANNNVVYPTWCIVFDPMGNCIQVVSPLVANLSNTYEVDCTIGTLEQDQDTGVWSCDPLYHGFWLSQDSPSLQDISKIVVSENKKYLANPVFGEEAFTLNFLNAINENITGLRSDLTSLQSAMQSSISNQTSTFQNMDAPSNFDPTDVNNMLEYGSLESDFHAPSTDDIFSVDSGTFADGMGFWRDRMNELLFFSESPALAMTVLSLTLGLAVLIIGRRFSGGGAA